MTSETILQVVVHSFEVALFQVAGRLYEQTRGALIGFPTSAALCIATVMVSEMQLLSTLRPSQTRQWLAMRYVDNLMTLHLRRNKRSTLPKQLLSAFFYGDTVVLEYETDFGYLGMRLVPWNKSYQVEVLVPGYEEVEHAGPYPPTLHSSRWRYRTAASSGSFRGLMTGFESRLHNAARFGVPSSRSREAIAKLYTIAIICGMEIQLLRRSLRRHRRKHPHVYTRQFTEQIASALRNPRPQAIQACRRAVGYARDQH